MTISAELRVAARAAYRELWRASSQTFAGERRRNNLLLVYLFIPFRAKMRDDATKALAVPVPGAIEEHVKLTRDLALFLRRNIIQGQQTGENSWRLRVTKDTELGDNDTVKQPKDAVELNNRRARKQEKQQAAGDSAPAGAASDPPHPMYFSQLKRAVNRRKVPELREEDLEESFVRGTGPGGQSINKTANNVQLVHKPTGIRVFCQETRSLEQNRKRARNLMIAKLDQLYNPGISKEDLQRAKMRERERRRRKKAKKRAKERSEGAGADQDD
ncbi:RF-1 domain-containing protein [Schizophyllum fasciatum]